MLRTPTPPRFSIWQTQGGKRIARGFVLMVCVFAYGVIGYLLYGWDFSDAIYQVGITITGAGLGEVHPIKTPGLRFHTVSIIIFGLIATGYLIAGVLQFITEEELQRYVGHRRVMKQIETLSGHTIVAGMGRMGALICAELQTATVRFVLIERDPARIAEAEARGWLAVLGEATEEKTLENAGLMRARSLVTAIPNDAENVFITLTAHQMAPKVQIIARAEQPSTQKKLKQAGASHIVLPAAIGAHRIVSILTNPSAVEFTELVTHRHQLEIEMDEVLVERGGALDGISLRDADVGRRTGSMVIAVKRADGRVEFPPSGNEPFAPGDSVVLLGRRENIEQFRQEFRHGAAQRENAVPHPAEA